MYDLVVGEIGIGFVPNSQTLLPSEDLLLMVDFSLGH